MKKTILLLLTLLLAFSLLAGCDMRNGRVTNSPAAETLIPGNTPGHTPVVTDVPAPTATHFPSATPGTGPSPTGEPTGTIGPNANSAAGRGF